MRYTSTRSRADAINVSFEEALTSGYAADGGLFVPERLPRLTGKDLQAWSKLTYSALLQRILRLFIDVSEVSNEELETVCQTALTGFVNPSHAVPVLSLLEARKDDGQQQQNSSSSCSFYVAELFHGPTFCFKDLGMRAVIGLLSLFATKRRQHITLLVSTTGDTGPAAVQAVSDVNNPLLKIVVHYPHQQISDLQRKQLTTVQSENVKVVAFQGGGDDMDQPIKNMLASSSNKKKNNNKTQQESGGDTNSSSSSSLWTGVNSYNIGRPITQMVHYVWTYLRIAEQEGFVLPDDDKDLLSSSSSSSSALPTIDIILPTGAMGNVAAGFMAQKMGLPIRKFVTAVNVNDITHSVIQTGAFHRQPAMKKTLSEAINIQVPYNFERLLYYVTDGDSMQVKKWYDAMSRTGKIDLEPSTPWLSKLQDRFDSARVTDTQMCETAARIYADYNYLADPHTAVAFSAALQLDYLAHSNNNNDTTTVHDDLKTTAAKTNRPTALLATASPCKFQHAVTLAVGEAVWKEYYESSDCPTAAKRLLELPERAPTVYAAAGKSLEETQVQWEAMTRKLVAELEGASD